MSFCYEIKTKIWLLIWGPFYLISTWYPWVFITTGMFFRIYFPFPIGKWWMRLISKISGVIFVYQNQIKWYVWSWFLLYKSSCERPSRSDHIIFIEIIRYSSFWTCFINIIANATSTNRAKDTNTCLIQLKSKRFSQLIWNNIWNRKLINPQFYSNFLIQILQIIDNRWPVSFESAVVTSYLHII